MSNPVFWENKKNIINLSSAVLAQRVVKVKIKVVENLKMKPVSIHSPSPRMRTLASQALMV